MGDSTLLKTSEETKASTSVSLDSRMVQDYIKAVYEHSEWGEKGMSVSSMAQQMKVAISTASENIRRLTQSDLLIHQPYKGVFLTKKGRKLAVQMIRKHRLIETYLYEKLDYEWDELHEEAEILEHAASDRLIDHIDAALGYPLRDPHGDPIPTKDGFFETVPCVRFDQLALGQTGKVIRVSDDIPQLLRYLESQQIRPGVELAVYSRHPEAGITVVKLGAKEITLGQPAVEAIWVHAPKDNRSSEK